MADQSRRRPTRTQRTAPDRSTARPSAASSEHGRTLRGTPSTSRTTSSRSATSRSTSSRTTSSRTTSSRTTRRPAAGSARRRPTPAVKRHKGFKPPLRIPLAKPSARLHVVLVAVAVAISLCGGRLLQLQGFDSSAYAAVSAEALTRNLPLLPTRGEILDRNGLVMAETSPAVAVTADPSLTTAKAAEFAEVVGRNLGMSPATLMPLLTKVDKTGKPARFVYLKKQVPAMTYTRLAKELNSLDLYGVFRESDPVRSYPGGTVAGALIGYLNVNDTGVSGLEQTLNTQLTGVKGSQVYESSPNGPRIPLGTNDVTPAQNGTDFVTTIDSELQFFAEKRIAAAVKDTKADWGFAITMDLKTGELLALAQAPTVNAADPENVGKDQRGVWAVNENYEPGSVEKVLTSAAVLDSGTATVNTPLEVPNRLPSGPTTIKDHFEHGLEPFTMRGVIAESSNIGTAMLARKMPKAQLAAYLKKFGLGAQTGIELPNEAKGIAPGADMLDMTRDRVAFGQAIAVTGIQEISAIAGLVNDGIYHPPTLLKSASTSDGTPVALPTKEPRRIVSSETSTGIRDLMRAVVDNGASTIKLKGYQSGGKTGTAERADPNCGCYRGYVTSYVGFAPLNDPRIITYVVLNNPRKGDTGSGTAGPAYQDIMQFALPRYSVPPTTKVLEPKPIRW